MFSFQSGVPINFRKIKRKSTVEMGLSDYEIFFPGNDFHLKVSILGIDYIDFVYDGCDSLVDGFRKDNGSNMVFIRKKLGAKVHMNYMSHRAESTRDVIEVWREGCSENFI
jgi:hypothetical protein